jgi:DNA polymerase-1
MENRESAFLSKELVTIHCETPVEVSFEELRLDPPDVPKLLHIYQELDFRSLINRYRDLVAAEEAEISGPRPSIEALSQQAAIPPEALASEQTEPDAAAGELTPMRTLEDVEHTYTIVRTEDELKQAVEYLGTGPVLAFDLETDHLDWQYGNIVGFSFSTKPGEGYYVPVANEEIRQVNETGSLFDTEVTKAATEGLPLDLCLRYLTPLLEDEALPKTGQNGKFDMLYLRKHDVHVRPLAFDSMLASYVIDSSLSHGMDALAERYLHYKPISITELIGMRGKNQLNMRDVDLDTVGEYAAEDADITIQLYHRLDKELREHRLEEVAEQYEFPLVEVLTEMEFTGVYIDVPSLKDISVELERSIHRVEEEIHELAGHPFNIGSPKQLGEILFEQLKLPAKKKTKTGYSTDQFVMEELAALHPLPEKILEYRQATKLKSTYVDALPSIINPATGRVHTSYNQAVTSTGRLSSVNPNLQNIPIRSEIGREVRKAFVAGIPDGAILSADYSQIELRIMAHICGDEALVRAFKEKFDIHTAAAMNVFGVTAEEVTGNMRRKAKEVNFGIMYGIGPFGLARRLKIDKTEAQELIKTYFAKYPGVQQYINSTLEMARERGYVETLSGRRRYYPNINAKNQALRGGEERAAINMPVQGTASDIIKLAMINIHREMHKQFPKANMLLQVHDELVFEAPRDQIEELAVFVKEKMETAFPLGEVPVVVETGIGGNWFEAH